MDERLNPIVRRSVIFVSGLCAVFCFMPFSQGYLAFFVLIPFVVLSDLRSKSRPYKLDAYIFGLGYFLGCLYWIAQLEPASIAIPALRIPATGVLCLYLALFMVIAAFFTRRLCRAGLPFVVAFPLAWMATEYLRSLGPLGFPWVSLGYSQTPYLPLIQQASVIGVYGISGWLALINALVASFIVSRKRVYVWLLIPVFGVPLIFGFARLQTTEQGESLRVALIQPNVSGTVKWDEAYRDSTMKLLMQMTREAGDVDLAIWPETAVPFHLKHSPSWLDSIARLATQVNSAILIGYPDYETLDGSYRFYNSAMLMNEHGNVMGEYRKIHLVPFGEMIPFEDRFTFLQRIDLGEGNFSPGDTYTVFTLAGIPFSVAICFESIYPDLIGEFVSRGARFIVNITNDEWFGPSAGPYQHAQMAIMRAVEFEIGIARCANTGISMFVDPYGRVVSRSPLFEKLILKGEVVGGEARTPYGRFGTYLEISVLLLVLALVAIPFLPPPWGRS